MGLFCNLLSNDQDRLFPTILYHSCPACNSKSISIIAASFSPRHQHLWCFHLLCFFKLEVIYNPIIYLSQLYTRVQRCMHICTLISNTMAIFSFRHNSSPPPPDSLYADPKSIEHQAAPGTEDQYAMVDKNGKKNTKPKPTPPEAVYQVCVKYLLHHTHI